IQAPLPFQSKSITVGLTNPEEEELAESKRGDQPSPGKLITPKGNYATLRGEYIRFGSSINSDVVIADCYGVSDEQFRLAEDEDRHILVNLAPNENQTRVNAMAVCERPLKDQDVIFAGQLRLTYRAPSIGQEEQKAKETTRQSYSRAVLVGAIVLLAMFFVVDLFKSSTPKPPRETAKSSPKIVMPGEQTLPPVPPPARPKPPAPRPTPPDAAASPYPSVAPGYTPSPQGSNLPYNVVAAPDRQMVQAVRQSQSGGSSFDHVTLFEESVVNHYEQVLIDAYLSKGHRSWKWDREAITALSLFARIYTGEGVAFSRTDFSALKKAVSHCIQSGCRDAAILHAKERIQSTEYGLIAKAGDPTPSPTFDEQVLAAYPAEVRAPSYLHKMRMAERSEDKTSKDAILAELIASTAEWNVDSRDPYLSTIYWDHVEQAVLAAVDVMEGNTRKVISRFETSFKMHSVPKQVRDVFRTAVPIWLAWKEYSKLGEKEKEEGSPQDYASARSLLEGFWTEGLKVPILPELMLKVALLSGDRDLFSIWYERSIVLNPEDPTPYRLKAEFLSPQNYGGVDELEAYADSLIEDMDSPNLPWLGLEVYTKMNDMIEGDLAKRAEIWNRVSSTFDTFFKRYPDAHYRKAQKAAISWELGYEEEAREQLKETGLDYAAFTINFQPELGEDSPHDQMMKEVEEAEFRVRLEGAILGGPENS
ncbi:MAG: hypothetical protein AAGH89_02995, partial [Verrucomicrobiota bacterium]